MNVLPRIALFTCRRTVLYKFPSQASPQLICGRASNSLAAQLASQTPSYAKKCVGGWLAICSGLTAGTVLVGGITRLTRSGLSMTDWSLFGSRPPWTASEWQAEFDKYKQFPEYKLANYDMTLTEFKRIWWTEYIHRMAGRTVGAAFFLPAAFFWHKKWLAKTMKPRIFIFAGLLIAQGLLGWFMVRSGLEEETASKYAHPRVSHYRLAAHLGTAFVFYSLLFNSTLAHLMPAAAMSSTSKGLTSLKRAAYGVKGLVFLTALSGAFVAGIDAGLIYNTYPKMGEKWIPSASELRDPNITPAWLNMFENPVATQFNHRLLGEITFTAVACLWLASKRVSGLHPRAKLALNILMLAGLTQVTLGISTLLSSVKTELASAHQLGALGLLSAALWTTHELKLVKYIPK